MRRVVQLQWLVSAIADRSRQYPQCLQYLIEACIPNGMYSERHVFRKACIPNGMNSKRHEWFTGKDTDNLIEVYVSL